jgi:hypothetical protein
MIGLLSRRGCEAHQAALVEFASHRANGPDVRRALDHVDRCHACEDDLAATTLVLHALRRLHEETRRVEPSPDGWARLRARLAATRREPSRLLSGLPGIVVAAAICAMLVGPAAIAGGGRPVVYNEAPRGLPSPSLQFEQSRERATLEGLLPEPASPRPYRGVRIAPPPITADLPASSGRQTRWVEEVVIPAPSSEPTGSARVIEQRQAGRR